MKNETCEPQAVGEHNIVSSPLSLEEISNLFSSYLQCSTDSERSLLINSHPDIFVPEMISCLAAAEAEMQATVQEVRSTYTQIDRVAGALGVSNFLPLQSTEGSDYVESSIHKAFSTQLANFLVNFKHSHDNDNTDAGKALSNTSAVPLLTARYPIHASLPAGTQSSASSLWYQKPEVVMEVLSYLPAKDILYNAEDVCSAWQYWLYAPEISRFFWIGILQREFSDHARSLIESTSGSQGEMNFLNHNWREMVMLCVVEQEEKTNGN